MGMKIMRMKMRVTSGEDGKVVGFGGIKKKKNNDEDETGVKRRLKVQEGKKDDN